jgi:hypothetical protein
LPNKEKQFAPGGNSSDGDCRFPSHEAAAHLTMHLSVVFSIR